MRWKIRLGLPLVFSAGCAGHAEYVTRRQDGGVLRLVGARGKANADARDHMAKHCGPVPHQIVEEGEAVVGSDTAIGTNTDYRGTTTTSSLTGNSTTTGNATTRGTATTRDATEWRVHYQCQATLAPSSPSPPTYFCTTSPAEPSRTVCRPTMAACAGDQARLVREGRRDAVRAAGGRYLLRSHVRRRSATADHVRADVRGLSDVPRRDAEVGRLGGRRHVRPAVTRLVAGGRPYRVRVRL